MKYAVRILLPLALFLSTLPAWAGGEAGKATKRLDDATAVLSRFTSDPEHSIPSNVLANAKCVAIVPSLVKAGFIVGGQHGDGVASCRNDGKWSAPGFFSISGGSVGAQIGVSGTSLVLLFMDQPAVDQLLSGDWKIEAGAGVAAGPVGAQSTTSPSGVLTYSRSKGAFAGVSLNGAHVHADKDAINGFYGKAYPYRDLLTGAVRPPQQAQPFLASIQREFHGTAEAGK